MESVHPRLATDADERAIGELMEASVRGIFPQFHDAQQTAAMARYYNRADPALIADGTYYVIEEDGELVACGGWSRRPRLDTGTVAGGTGDRLLDPRTEAARIRLMFVRPDRARRGLASRILEACEAAARAEGFTRLGLRSTLAGLPLYEKRGFRVTADAPIELPDGTVLGGMSMEKDIRHDR